MAKKTVVVTPLAARLLQVHDADGDFRVEVPGESKITFGPAIPMSSKGTRMHLPEGSQVYALRVYKGPTERAGLLAVFPGITGFRDLGLVKVHRPARAEGGEMGWVEDQDWRMGQEVSKKLTPSKDDWMTIGGPVQTQAYTRRP